MARWFLSTRVHSVGGPVGPVKILDADRPGSTADLTDELLAATQGREIFFGTHGFEVNQADGISHLTFWFNNLQIGSATPMGILWPGDCVIPIAVDYIWEGHEALASADLLSAFLNTNFTGAMSFCFASHSLGARVVLQTIRGLKGPKVRRVLLMAGAIEDNCLVAEYADAAAKIDEISVLSSLKDDVLAFAFPLGNPLQRIIDHNHPLFRAALGHQGPAEPYPSALEPNWQIPQNLSYGHHHYLPGQSVAPAYSVSVDIPPENGPVPPADTPAQLAADPNLWKPAWSAAFASTRYQRP
ncbi:MAG TPA: alpha/beta hydrolase [Candidatus Dormibacteraeota bacterium]|nr:alpha/beta hydrolase [Candidatus Dormibacteraeota bacterium]